MADKTGISWTDATWNPVRGCSRVSAGCQRCYAEVQAARIVRMGKGKPTAYDGLVRLGGQTMVGRSHDRWTGEVRLVPEMLAWPLRKRKPLRIFVNSMSDLFHERLTNEQIAAVFGAMAAAPQHTFQVLTKRAKRMREWFKWAAKQTPDAPNACIGTAEGMVDDPIGRIVAKIVGRFGHVPWPLPNVWLGVSVENQDAADERIPELLRTPAAVRFLSCEPLLGPVRVDAINDGSWYDREGAQLYDAEAEWHATRGIAYYRDGEHGLGGGPRLDWIIAGCESGPGARPCEVDWLRSLRDQCASAGVAFFLKQAKEHVVLEVGPEDNDERGIADRGDGSKRKPGGVIELPLLDGVQHAAFPEVSR